MTREAPSPSAGVLVIGESLMDVVASPGGHDEHAGGSPMNVSVGLARLGSPVQLLTNLGTDARGVVIADYLASAGVPLVPGSIVDGRTSTATATLDDSGSASYEFLIDWSLGFVADLPDSSIVHQSALVHTGSIAAFLEPGASQLEAMLEAAAERRAIITFDPNIRPSIIGSKPDSLAVVQRLSALSTVVKVSDEDALWLFGELTPDGVVDRLLAMGATLAIVTLGASGALLATATDRVSVAGRRVTVADTIGAGDSFMSAVVHKLQALLLSGVDAAALAGGDALDQTVLADIGEFAVSCAAVTVSRPGSNPPTLAEALA
ncbi:carbohydrate kinase [Glaciihabitans sp. INWT7]|uniref:carbohydrate kinase family protein n=1 Tax=Glaciihabitans sp. INWT7 TaxID=2596912 RepID=UPI002106AE31|nr:carbohydrate kinase [Glaciihabitans sp. INWT7]